ncbi:DMT family transporter [Rhodobacteraceae bacterium NNCM2]|nr:DMT family transporter [Coraliihabitans acroporae]
MKATPRDWFLLCSLGLIWGASFMATSIATRDFDVLMLTAFRLTIGAIALSVLLVLRGEWLPGFSTGQERRFWLFALASAMVTNAFPFTFLSFAQRYVDSSFAGVSVASVPLFVLPMAHFLVPGEVMTWRRTIGFLLGFVGILVLLGFETLLEIGGNATMMLAQLACVATAFCYASGSIIAKRAPNLGLIRFGAAALILGALIVMPAALLIEGVPPALPSPLGMAAIAYLGLVPTGLAMVMLLMVIASAGPSFMSLVNYQVPVWAVLFGVLLLGEEPSPRLGIAVVLIFAGLAISQGLVGLRRGGHARG